LVNLLEKFLREEIDKVIVEHIKDKVLALDDLIGQYEDKTKKLAEEIESLRSLSLSISKIAAVFDVEAVLEQVVGDTLRNLTYEAARTAGAYGFRMRVGRDIVPLELPATLEVYHHCIYYLIGLKFIEGEGYGQYAIWEGAKIKLLQTFTRSKKGAEIGIAFRPLKFEGNEIFTVGPFLGNETGKLSISLIGVSTRPSTRLSAIGRITQD